MAIDITSNVNISSITASVDRGGWQMRFAGMQDTDLLAIHQKVTATFQGAFGGNFGAIRPAFTGYVMPIRFSFDVATSQTEYLAETSDGFLRKGWLQGIGFADIHTLAAPNDLRANYHQYGRLTAPAVAGEYMTMGRIVQHILGYYDDWGVGPASNPDWVAHTNMVYHATENPHGWITLDGVELTPFNAGTAPDGTMRVDRYNVRETDNLWSTLQQIARNEFFEIWFDKNDNLHYAKHPMYQAVLPAPVMTFDADFCAAPPIVEVRDPNGIRKVRIFAVTDAGETLTPADDGTEYPVTTTHTYGNTIDINRVRCNDADTAAQWAERYYKFANRPYTVRWTAPGLCGLLFEILDRVEITYSGTTANGVHVNWAGEKFWIHEITVNPGEGFGGTTTFLLEAENL